MTEKLIAAVSLKEYKQELDNLRLALTKLESTSEEYTKKAEELKEGQQKLNEVMAIGKKDVDAVAGSYNALSQEMSKLKKEWKNMEIGTDAWKEMAVRINDLNDQLKDADAQVGVFSRNVGDYANAFGQAFEKAAEELGRIDGPLGAVFTTVKQLIPVIKSANGTAVKGLKGVKAALVSTGIGALVVAVGLLVSHWGDLMQLVRGSKKDVDNLKAANDELNKTFEEQNAELATGITIMQAQGASTQAVNKEKIKLLQTQLTTIRATIAETKSAIAAREAHSWLGRVIRGEQKEYKELKEALEDLEGTEKKLANEVKNLEAGIIAANESAWKDSKKKADDLVKLLEENARTEKEKLTKQYQEELALLKKHHKSTKELTAKFNKDMAVINAKSAMTTYNTGVEERSLGLIGVKQNSSYWKKVYDNAVKNKEELVKFVTANYQEIYNANKEVLGRELNITEKNEIYQMLGFGSEVGYKKALKEADKEIKDSITNIRTSLLEETSALNNRRLANAATGTLKELEFNLQEAIKKYEAFKIYGWDKQWDKDLESSDDNTRKSAEKEITKFNRTAVDLQNNIVNARKAIAAFKSETDAFLKDYNSYEEKITRKPLHKVIIDSISEHKNPFKEVFNWLRTPIKDEIELTKKDIENYYDVLQSYFVDLEDELGNRIEVPENLVEGSEEWKKFVFENLQYFPEDARSIYLQKLQTLADQEKEILDQRKEHWWSLAGSVGDVMGSIGDIMNESVEYRKKQLIDAGKTEEEANAMLKEQFDNAKAFQIAQATINTIAGVVGAFMGITRDTGGWGVAAAAAQAAAVALAGAAQIQKIVHTEIGKTQNIDTEGVSVTPRLAEYSPERTSNLTSASDTDNLANALAKQPIYVKVSDIDRAQKKVQVRDNESKF